MRAGIGSQRRGAGAEIGEQNSGVGVGIEITNMEHLFKLKSLNLNSCLKLGI